MQHPLLFFNLFIEDIMIQIYRPTRIVMCASLIWAILIFTANWALTQWLTTHGIWSMDSSILYGLMDTWLSFGSFLTTMVLLVISFLMGYFTSELDWIARLIDMALSAVFGCIKYWKKIHTWAWQRPFGKWTLTGLYCLGTGFVIFFGLQNWFI